MRANCSHSSEENPDFADARRRKCLETASNKTLPDVSLSPCGLVRTLTRGHCAAFRMTLLPDPELQGTLVLAGGGSSHMRTRLRGEFPVPTGKYRELHPQTGLKAPRPHTETAQMIKASPAKSSWREQGIPKAKQGIWIPSSHESEAPTVAEREELGSILLH